MTDDDSDAMLDRLDRGEPAASAEEAQARAPYERLISRIRDLPDEAPPAGWESRLEERRRRDVGGRARRRRWLGPGVLGVVGAAAVFFAVFVVYCRAPGPDDFFVLEVNHADGAQRRGNDVLVHDVLHVRAHQPHAVTQLRVYRDRMLVASCPGHTGCRGDGTTLALVLELDAPGDYTVLLLGGDHPPPASTGHYELDVDELDKARFDVAVKPLPTPVMR